MGKWIRCSSSVVHPGAPWKLAFSWKPGHHVNSVSSNNDNLLQGSQLENKLPRKSFRELIQGLEHMKVEVPQYSTNVENINSSQLLFFTVIVLVFRFIFHEGDLRSLSCRTSAVGSGESSYQSHFEYVELIILHFPKMWTSYFGAFSAILWTVTILLQA